MSTEIYTILAVQIAGFTLVLIRTFSKSYVSEKGKGLATKEDIGEITDKIEQVRIDYNKQLEVIKGSIEFDVFTNQHFLQKSTEILLKFYDTIIILSYDNLSREFGDITGPDIEKAVFDFTEDTLAKFRSLKVDYHRMLIFMNSQDKLVTDCAKILQISIRLSHIYEKHIGNIKLALFREHKALNTNDYSNAVTNRDNVSDAYYKALKPVREQFNEMTGELILSLMDYFTQKKLIN